MYMQLETGYDVTNMPGTQPQTKYDSYGWGWYFRFHDDNNMSYRYILSIIQTEIGQLNTCNPEYCDDNKR